MVSLRVIQHPQNAFLPLRPVQFVRYGPVLFSCFYAEFQEIEALQCTLRLRTPWCSPLQPGVDGGARAVKPARQIRCRHVRNLSAADQTGGEVSHVTPFGSAGSSPG